MTNKEEAILNIREALKKLMSFSAEKSENTDEFEKTKMEYEDMKLKDGSMISVEKGKTLEVGVPVYKKDDTGNLVPCEDGTYELENGTTMTVKGGMVESVSETGSNPQEAAAGTPATDAKMSDAEGTGEDTTDPAEGTEPSTEEGKNGDMNQRVKALEDQVAQILEMLTSMTKVQEETMSQVKAFAALPDAEPIKTGKKPAEDVYSKARTTFNANKGELEELRTLMSKSSDAYGSFTVKQ